MKPHIFCVALALATLQTAHAESPLIRFPAMTRDSMIFVARGELWRVPSSGGRAVRLVGGPGQALFPHVSPDGRRVAFTWRKQGMSHVYVVDVDGGEARQLTHGPSLSPYDNAVTGWTPDGSILFVSQRMLHLRGEFDTYRVSPLGGLAVPLGLGHSGTSSMGPDGRTLTYDTSFRNFIGDRWKHYRGGQVSRLASYDLAGHGYREVTSGESIDTFPMWWQGSLYFLSDRGKDHRLNLWRQDASGFSQITDYTKYDIDAPSVGPGGIAYQVGGDVYVLDQPGKPPRRVVVEVPGETSPARVNPGDAVQLADVAGQPIYSVDARRRVAWIVSAGMIFRVDGQNAVANLTPWPGTASSYPAVSPDGRELAFVSDAKGEQQVMLMPSQGGVARSLTSFKSGVLYTPRWLPDGTGLIVPDSENNLWYVPRRGSARLLAHDAHGAIRDAAVSPDSTRVVYSKVERYPDRALHVVDLQTGRDQLIGPASNDDHDPVFSPDGRDLFFLSSRREQPVPSDRDDLNIAGVESTGLYTAPLNAGDDAFPHKKALVRGDTEPSQLLRFATPVPLPGAAAITALTMGSHHLYLRSQPVATLSGKLDGMKNEVIAVDLSNGQSRAVATDAETIGASAGGEGVAWASGKAVHVLDADHSDAGSFTLEHAAPVSMPFAVQATEVLRQVWRYDRDLFWDRAMGGLDWSGMLKRYLPLMSRAASHEDVLYVVGELQGELSSSHMFVAGGSDSDGPAAPRTAMLGIDFVLDSASGRYRIAHAYRGDSSRPRFRAPLGAPGVDAKDGDFILSINGAPLRAPEDPYALLPSGDAPVTLDIAETSTGPIRRVEVMSIHDEHEIRRLDWIERNKAYVDEDSGGCVGYLHLRDFSANGTEDLMRQWNAQAHKDGLVIDIRGNEGGFTSQWVLDLLLRRHAGEFINRQGAHTDLPGGRGPARVVVITDEFSASDGDQFPYYFRKYDLGRVVGERTWGGVRGIQGRIPLIDGTTITVPKDSLVDADAGFILENRGAEPDVEVRGRPPGASGGVDEQLKEALNVLRQGRGSK